MLIVFVVASLFVLNGCVIIERRTTTSSPPTGSTPSGWEEIPQAEPAALSSSSDRRLVGSLGWALLSPEVPRAVIEIDQLGDATIGQPAVDALQQNMRQHGGKGDIEVVIEEAPATRDVYSLENLISTAEEHRSRSSGDGTVALHVLVLPGRFETEGVPGVAFHATTVALFPQEIRRLLPSGAAVGAFEAAVATHELGHTFGLVNRTGVGEFHEDSEHPGHTADEDSVMYWAIESPGLGQLFGSGPPSSFNAADRREMENIRGQRP